MAAFQLLRMTPAARARVQELMHNHQAYGLIIGVKKGGCAGMEYTIELANSPLNDTDMVEDEGARVYIAKNAVLFLLGTELDFEVTALRTGFIFNNPNQTSACGCGESVALQEATPQ